MTDQAKGEAITAQTIVAHMRQAGPMARVLYVAPNHAVLRQGLESGSESLLMLYGNEFTGNVAQRIHHVGGGHIDVLVLISHLRPDQRLRGQIYSLTVTENVPEDETNAALYVLLKTVTLFGPNPVIIKSANGAHN